LSAGQAEMIQSYLQGGGKTMLSIYQTLPFSPFIVLGAVITILFRGSLLSVMMAGMPGF